MIKICFLALLALVTAVDQSDPLRLLLQGADAHSLEDIVSLLKENLIDTENSWPEGESLDYDQNTPRDFQRDTFYSGYFPTGDADQDMFYLLFESRLNATRDEDPLLIWIRGTPGCAATGTLFSKNSPYTFGVNETTGFNQALSNHLSWNNFSNVLYLDNPIGVGYSYMRVAHDYFYNSDQVVRNFIHFMKSFLDVHDQFQEREIYFVGQDFGAGKYIPAFVQALKAVQEGKWEDSKFEERFLLDSKKEWSEWINVKGMLLIDPLFDELKQTNSTVEFAEKRGLISSATSFFMGLGMHWCNSAISSQNLFYETVVCTLVQSLATGNPLFPTFDIRNIKQECPSWFDCQPSSDITTGFMNQDSTMTTLFKARPHKVTQMWSDCSGWYDWNMRNEYKHGLKELTDEAKNKGKEIEDFSPENYEDRFPGEPLRFMKEILDDGEVKVLILAADLDYKVNHLGVHELVQDLEWGGHAEFHDAKPLLWKFENITALETIEKFQDQDKKPSQHLPADVKQFEVGGLVHQHKTLAFMRVPNSGLRVYQEKPDLMFALLQEWINKPELKGVGE